jgi:hypothetical protein
MIASIVMGVSIIVLTWIYSLSGPVANLFTQLISVDGLLYAAFYVLTALATVAYYWHRIFNNARNALLVGLLPAGAIAFLCRRAMAVEDEPENMAAPKKKEQPGQLPDPGRTCRYRVLGHRVILTEIFGRNSMRITR